MAVELTHKTCRKTHLVEVGKGKGSYKIKYAFCRHQIVRAVLYFNSTNVHSGYKKRLVRVYADGRRNVLSRVLT